MEGIYEVRFGANPAGKVKIERMGLYYSIHCRCQLSGAVVCRLVAQCGDEQIRLGIPVPSSDGFSLDTKIPIKKLGQGTPSFFLIPKAAALEGHFVPIYPDEPFAYIERLKSAFLERRGGRVGAVLN